MRYPRKSLLTVGAIALLFLGACGDPTGSIQSAAESASETEVSSPDDSPNETQVEADPAEAVEEAQPDTDANDETSDAEPGEEVEIEVVEEVDEESAVEVVEEVEAADVDGQDTQTDQSTCVGDGIIVNTDGSVCEDGTVVASAPTGRNPIELGDIADDIDLDIVSTSIEGDGTYTHELDFRSEQSYADLCDRFVAAWRTQGYEGTTSDCAGRGSASFKRSADASTLRFIPIKDGRALVTLKAPSNNDLVEIVAESVPGWSTQPNQNPVKLERIVSAEQVDLEIDYSNDGMFPQHCEAAMGEAIGQGFELRSGSECEDGAGVSFDRSNLTFRITNAFEPLITYKYLIAIEG